MITKGTSTMSMSSENSIGGYLSLVIEENLFNCQIRIAIKCTTYMSGIIRLVYVHFKI